MDINRGPITPRTTSGGGGGSTTTSSGTYLSCEDPLQDEAMMIPGPPGSVGAVGAPGADGAVGPAGPLIFLPGDDAEEAIVIPGPSGAIGAAGGKGDKGDTGAAGQLIYLEADQPEEVLMIPGPPVMLPTMPFFLSTGSPQNVALNTAGNLPFFIASGTEEDVPLIATVLPQALGTGNSPTFAAVNLTGYSSRRIPLMKDFSEYILTPAGVYVYDDFFRANENPLAGNWTTSHGASNNFQIRFHRACGVGSGSNVFYTGVTLNADQYVKAWITTVNANGGIAVRGVTNGASYNEYMAAYDTGTGAINLYRCVAGSFTLIASVTGLPPSVAGDTLTLSAAGVGATVTLNVYINGILALTFGDTNAARLVAAGYTGMRSDVATQGVLAFEAGNL